MRSTKIIVFLLAVAAGGLTARSAYFRLRPPLPQPTGNTPEAPSVAPTLVEIKKFATISVGDHTLDVEVVSSPDDIATGLSDRDSIGSGGMLFLINPPKPQTFWMKSMKFSIDIVWIDDGKISGIIRHLPIPQPGIPEQALPLFASPGPVSHVLEIPAGKSDELGFAVGDPVSTTDPGL